MPDFIDPNTLETIASLVRELDGATTELNAALETLQNDAAAASGVTPQEFVERVLALDEQVSRFRLLLPLCTSGLQINEAGRALSLADLLVETRSEFDALARAQLESLIAGSPE